MTPDQALEAAAVMVAFANGRKIQYRYKFTCEKWKPVTSPVWNWGRCEYRVAPEPWEGKIWVNSDGRVGAFEEDVDPECWTKHGWRLIQAKEVEE